MGFLRWLTGGSDESKRDYAVGFLAARANQLGRDGGRVFAAARTVAERSDIRPKDVPGYLRSWARDSGDSELARAADDIERGR